MTTSGLVEMLGRMEALARSLPPRPARLDCAADVWASVQAATAARGPILAGPLDRYLGVPVVVDPEAEPGWWRLVGHDGAVIVSGRS